MAKKGKYEDIIDTLPKSFGTDPDEQDKINVMKKAILESEPDPEEITNDAIEDLVLEISAMMKVLNDKLIRGVGENRTGSRFAQLTYGVRAVRDLTKEQEKATKIILRAYEQLLVAQYEVECTKSIKFDNGGGVRIQWEPSAKVIDKDANRKWAMENGLENSLCLPWPTINSITKELLLKGEPEPEGVEATARVKVVRMKA